jgi:hypothetical protein
MLIATLPILISRAERRDWSELGCSVAVWDGDLERVGSGDITGWDLGRWEMGEAVKGL